jgi:hypothetical protein
MPLPRIRFVWSFRPPSDGSRLPGLFAAQRRHEGGSAIAVSVRGALLWGGTLGLALYLTATAAAFLWFDHKPVNFITYSDLALPWRWPQVVELRGAAQIEEGLADLRDSRYASALLKLQAGLRHSPHSSKGRIALAKIQLALGQRPKAEQTLLAGLADGYPGRAYLTELFGIASSDENFPLWLHACDTALPQLAGKPQLADDRAFVVWQKLAALLAAGRTDEAGRLAESEGEGQGPVMREFKVLALLKAGQTEPAVDFLAQWRAQARLAPELTQVRMLQVRVFREAGRPDDMNRILDELRAANSSAPTPYIYAIVQRLLAGRRDEAEKSFASFLLRFGTKAQYHADLAVPLGQIGEEALLGKLIANAQVQRLPLLAIQRALTSAQMKNGHWAAAATTLAAMEPKLPKDDPTGKFWFTWTSLTAAAARSPAQDAQTALLNFIAANRNRLPLALYGEALAALRLAGRPATAQRVLAVARAVFPDSISLSEREKDIAKDLAATEAAAKPEPKPAPAAIMAGSSPFLAQLSATIQAGDHAAALEQIRAVRAESPAWLAAHDDELRRDEVLVTARLHDTAALTAAASLWLDGSAARAQAGIELAQQLHEVGTTAESERLLELVLRKNPGFAAAARLLAEWRPAAAASPTATAPALTPAVIGNEKRFLQVLADTMQAGNHAAALEQIRAARAARPAWLAVRDDELRRDEILLDGRLGDTTAMSVVVRLYLNGTSARSQAVVALAQQLHEAGHPAEALRLLEEILRQSPNFGLARRLLTEWEPTPPTP